MPRCPPESAGFSTAGTPTVSSAARALSRSRAPAKAGCGTPASASVAAHRDLVGHQIGGVGADPGQPERLGDRRDDGHGAVCRDGQDPVDTMAAADLGDRLHVGEVHRFAFVRHREPGRLRIAVDRDDAEAELLRAQDRTTLVAACADEEDRAHVARDGIRVPGARYLEPGVEDRRDPVPASRDARVRALEHRADLAPRKSPSSSATSGLEPGISSQRGGGASLPNGSCTAASAAQAAAGSGWSPPVGSHSERPADRIAVAPGRPERQLQVDPRVAAVSATATAAAREPKRCQRDERRCGLPHAPAAVAKPGKRKLIRLTRAISQPFVAENCAQTRAPLSVPVTSACCGPP